MIKLYFKAIVTKSKKLCGFLIKITSNNENYVNKLVVVLMKM